MLKKYGWIAALFVAIAMVFMGCPGDDDKPGHGPDNPDLVEDASFWVDLSDYGNTEIVDSGAGEPTVTENLDGTLTVSATAANQRVYFNLTEEQIELIKAAFASNTKVTVQITATGTGSVRIGFCDPTAGSGWQGSNLHDSLSIADSPIIKEFTKHSDAAVTEASKLIDGFLIQSRGASANFTIESIAIMIGDAGLPPAAPKTVNISSIAGIYAPAYGGSPESEIEETAQFTGTVTWDPEVVGMFGPGIIYTATITLTAKAGWTFDGVTPDFFELADVHSEAITTINNAADSGVITVVFEETSSTFIPVIDITLTTTDGILGEDIHLDGLLVGDDEEPGHQHIIWALDPSDAGTVNSAASLSGNVLNVSDIGIVRLTATVPNGADIGTPLTVAGLEVTITIVEVTGITGIPTKGMATVPVHFNGVTVTPSDATFTTIGWAYSNDNGSTWTPFVLTSGSYTFATEGTYKLRATIANGIISSDALADFVKDDAEIVISEFVDAIIIDVDGTTVEDVTITGVNGTVEYLPGGVGYIFSRNGSWEGSYAYFSLDLGSAKVSSFEKVEFTYQGISGDITSKSLSLVVGDSAATVGGSGSNVTAGTVASTSQVTGTSEYNLTFNIDSKKTAADLSGLVYFSIYMNSNVSSIQIKDIVFTSGEACDDCEVFPCVCVFEKTNDLNYDVTVTESGNGGNEGGTIDASSMTIISNAHERSFVRVTVTNSTTSDRGGWGVGSFGGTSFQGSSFTPSLGAGVTGYIDIPIKDLTDNIGLQNGIRMVSLELYQLVTD